ncbi:MAG: DUF1667 domain-containing protein [Treponema sp.]|nr:DUF1667 domain-containing protein [Treponema sp.]
MTKELTCIICPNGCPLTIQLDNDNKVVSVEGFTCVKGKNYAIQEMTEPQRTVSSSVLVKNGELPLVSVRLTKPVPKTRLFDVMSEIRKITVQAPVQSGTVLIHNILGYDSDLIATKSIASH